MKTLGKVVNDKDVLPKEKVVISKTPNQVKSIFVGTTAEYNALSDKTGVLAVLSD